MRFPFAKYGYRELAIFSLLFGALAVAGGWLVWWPLAVVFGVPLCMVVWFFRDPPRRIPDDPAAVVAPADGVVTDVVEVDEPDFIGGRALRVGIFLSIFNVHVNRAPCAGRVDYVKYREGAFHAAFRGEASTQNESNAVGLTLPGGGRMLVRQISGAVARRIVCVCGPGAELARGERFGMIKFGSRTELLVSLEVPFSAVVKVGQKVRGGSTVIGMMPPAGQVAEGSGASGAAKA